MISQCTAWDVEKWVKSLSRVRLCDPMDGSPPGSSVHGIPQARILEWVAISFSRGSSWPRDRTWVSHIVGKHFNRWATREELCICLCMYVCELLSHVQLFATPIAHQAPLSMKFPRKNIGVGYHALPQGNGWLLRSKRTWEIRPMGRHVESKKNGRNEPRFYKQSQGLPSRGNNWSQRGWWHDILGKVQRRKSWRMFKVKLNQK